MADSGDVTGLGGQLWRLYAIEQQAERDCEEKLRIYREAIHTYKRETVDYSRASKQLASIFFSPIFENLFSCVMPM
jgi:hypothetical protein